MELLMKKSLLALLIAAPLTMALSGCVIKINDDGIEHGFGSSQEDRSYKNRKKIDSIQLSASIVDMQQKLGVADFSEVYAVNDQEVRVLYYRTQRKHKDGITTKDECTYLEFVNGELIQTGNGGEYQKVQVK